VVSHTLNITTLQPHLKMFFSTPNDLFIQEVHVVALTKENITKFETELYGGNQHRLAPNK